MRRAQERYGMRGMTFVTLSVLLWLTGLSSAQVQPSAVIPSTAPTQAVSNLPSAQPAGSRTAAVGSHVAWDDVLLTVDGGGDSLRNILRQVARATGMKVTGGVPDERVFGRYGPGPVQAVLGSLFGGLDVNLVLVNSGPSKPKELVLTARNGGPSPPSPAQPLDLTEDVPATLAQEPHPGPHSSPDSFVPASRRDPRMRNPQGGGTDVLPSSSTDVPAAEATGGNGTGTDGATDANGQAQSPNGVRTPEQIFEELRRRQQGLDAAK